MREEDSMIEDGESLKSSMMSDFNAEKDLLEEINSNQNPKGNFAAQN